MQIGVPKEIKIGERRVAATPATVAMFSRSGHTVLIESGAGIAVGASDSDYRRAGATIVENAAEAYSAEMVLKVKEPQREEWPLLRHGQLLFCYLHLAAEPALVHALVEQGVIACAYETYVDAHGRLPLLAPMSEVAGRVAVQLGSSYLQTQNGGKGLLLGGVTGVTPGRVVIIGGGVAGFAAARVAVGLGAEVVILDRSLERLDFLHCHFGGQAKALYASDEAIAKEVASADLLIGAVLLRGRAAAKILNERLLETMAAGSVFVDIAIDQGGCSTTSRPTTFVNPTYTECGVIHCCVTNLPASSARTATTALSHATYDAASRLATLGWRAALRKDPGLCSSLNVCLGEVTLRELAEAGGFTTVDPTKFLG